MPVLSGASGVDIASGLAPILGMEYVALESRRFPDGEAYVRIPPESIESVRSESVVLVSNTFPDSGIMQTLFLLGAIRDVRRGDLSSLKGEWEGETHDVGPGIFLAIPYYGYARQDRKDEGRVPITAKLVANLITRAGADRVLAMDLHAAQVQGFFDIPVDHLYAKPVLLKHLLEQRQDSGRELTVVSPDVGGVKIARSYADALGAELAIVAKQRISATVVEPMKLIGEVEGRDAFIVDDMTETAGTLCAAAETLRSNGSGRIFAGVSHAVLGDLGCKRIMNSAIDEIITTNSTPPPPEACRSKVTTLDVAALLGEAIQRIHNGKSVSSLFDIDSGSV